MILFATSAGLSFLAQLDLSNFTFPGGVRGFTGFTMLVHIFFAELFVGFAIAAPVLQAWGSRTGSPRMDRLAHSMVRFNVLTFSTGATFAVLFMVLLVGFYPRVTAALFTHFFYFIAIAMASMLLALWGMYSYYYKWDRYSVLSKRRHALLAGLRPRRLVRLYVHALEERGRQGLPRLGDLGGADLGGRVLARATDL